MPSLLFKTYIPLFFRRASSIINKNNNHHLFKLPCFEKTTSYHTTSSNMAECPIRKARKFKEMMIVVFVYD